MKRTINNEQHSNTRLRNVNKSTRYNDVEWYMILLDKSWHLCDRKRSIIKGR
eukprot:GAHX01004021.1.p2 GENE.GAHX01004021.1~~GAHX01004021.1.p2  ORF type:complete len:52 (-),score=1.15 GAHX01004021.1:34-189(-)